MNDGVQVVVSNGRVSKIATSATPIPRDGFVIYFRGNERMAARFHIGQRCSYHVEASNGDPRWSSVQEAIGCDPRLLTDGLVTLDARSKGFRDPKALSLLTARSMVGISRDNVLILATSSGTMRQMADVMKSLGAWQAMNLDGGASSGLWANGKTLTAPGRLLNNVLLVLPVK